VRRLFVGAIITLALAESILWLFGAALQWTFAGFSLGPVSSAQVAEGVRTSLTEFAWAAFNIAGLIAYVLRGRGWGRWLMAAIQLANLALMIYLGLGAVIPVYNLIVIAASVAIAAGLGFMLTRTAFGRIIRAAADNREMAEALGVDMRGVYARVFTLGTALGTLGGALVIPATAAMSEMGIELIVEAFAVVVIGGLGSMRGALVGALVVGVLRSVAISVYPEIEMLLIYLIVIAVLLLRPRGLFGGAAA